MHLYRKMTGPESPMHLYRLRALTGLGRALPGPGRARQGSAGREGWNSERKRRRRKRGGGGAGFFSESTAREAIPSEVGPACCRATLALNQSAGESRTPASQCLPAVRACPGGRECRLPPLGLGALGGSARGWLQRAGYRVARKGARREGWGTWVEVGLGAQREGWPPLRRTG